MSFRVSIEGRDIAFTCETGETVLDAAERAGYALPYSCRKGVCSTCEGELCSGSVAERSRIVEAPNGVLLCQAKPTSDLHILPKRIEKHDPSPRKTMMAAVYRISHSADDVTVLQLRFPAGERAKFKAGQYLRIVMPDGDTRNFSMANPPHISDGVELHIRQVPGGRFSGEILAALKPRDVLEVEIPFGDFYLRPDLGRTIVGIATGTGFAPFKAMIEDLIAQKCIRPFRLYWGARRKADLYLADLPQKWAARHSWFHFTPVLSEPDGEWDGRSGLVHDAVLHDIADFSTTDVFACGNPLMIEGARRACVRAGLPEDRFFADPFVPTGAAP